MEMEVLSDCKQPYLLIQATLVPGRPNVSRGNSKNNIGKGEDDQTKMNSMKFYFGELRWSSFTKFKFEILC